MPTPNIPRSRSPVAIHPLAPPPPTATCLPGYEESQSLAPLPLPQLEEEDRMLDDSGANDAAKSAATLMADGMADRLAAAPVAEEEARDVRLPDIANAVDAIDAATAASTAGEGAGRQGEGGEAHADTMEDADVNVLTPQGSIDGEADVPRMHLGRDAASAKGSSSGSTGASRPSSSSTLSLSSSSPPPQLLQQQASSSQQSSSLSPSSSSSASSPSSCLTPALWEFASTKIPPSITSSMFRPFAKFIGTQRSKSQVYNVEVELKYVDMAESFCCGYLKIEGLTANLPSITTYFEGEVIGTRYAFQTRHASWGANERTDLQHWSRFPAFERLKPAVKAHRHHDANFAGRQHVFMRWKERFLVPDHRQRDLEGASFDGFYYIMFDQCSGCISGIYFHSKTENFQRLELRFQKQQAWCPPSVGFR